MENENKKFKIVIISGKGGVGKSMLTSSLCLLFSKENKITAVDCDVDAPNLAIWLNETEQWQRVVPVNTFSRVKIDYDKCTNCNVCINRCRLGAIDSVDGKPDINGFLCDGCGACEAVCPHGAISFISTQSGEIKTKQTKYNFPLILGHLFSGEGTSGKVVSEVKKEADKFESELQIIDSAPGIGAPVLATLRDVDFAILVAEPTPSGFSDINRISDVVRRFNIPWVLIINKWDLNEQETNKIEEWAGDKMIGRISYDNGVLKAAADFTPVMETDLKVAEEIKIIYNRLKKRLEDDLLN
ncbi:MAG: P-loop NTPase [Parcubacteria group bacterium]|nr:P-loop NTPase [Parcubacteria group bacterium]